LRAVETAYRVDADRVYLAGLSMGAYGAWQLAAAYPDRFAALALVAGNPDPAGACALAHLPLWAFHNEADPVVPAAGSARLVEAVEACGGAARLTRYRDLEAGLWAHNAWKAAFSDPALYAWLLEHRRPGR
jgi:predicted peptidase